jgi:hypothetical protein
MAYISAEDVKAIRTELKQAFPTWKFAVRKGSGSLSVDVNVLQGTVDFSENFHTPESKHCQVNQYWIDSNWTNAEAKAALNKINEIMHNAPGRAGGKVFFDESDAMTDYFHTAFYTHLSIGAWNKPYALAK